MRCVALNEDGSRLIVGLQNGSVVMWNVDTTLLIGRALVRQVGAVNCVALNNDGTYAITGLTYDSLQAWDVNMSTAYGKPLLGHSDRVRSVSMSSSGKHVTSASEDLTIRIWDTGTSSQIGLIMYKNDQHSKFPTPLSCGDNCILSCLSEVVSFSCDDDYII